MLKKSSLLLVSLLLCLSPWIFTVWWWPCNLYVSISSTCAVVIFLVLIFALLLRQTLLGHVVPFITLLSFIPIVYGLIKGGTCHPISYYTTLAYVSPISLVCLIHLFVATTIFTCIMSHTRTPEEKEDRKKFLLIFKLFVLTVITCVAATWLPVLWVFTCDALPRLFLSSTCFSLLLWLIPLGRLLKDHNDWSMARRYVVFGVEYLAMASAFGACVYLNVPLFVDALVTCPDVTVTYSFVIYVAFGIFLSALTFWYFLLFCFLGVNCFFRHFID
jgi:hypothetical protein